MRQLMALTFWISKSKLIRIINQTLIVLFPIMLLGSFAEVVKYAFLTPSGYMATVFNIPQWLPFDRDLARILGVIFHCTIDMIALYGAYGTAYFTMKVYGESPSSAGAIGGLAFLIIAYRQGSNDNPGFSTTLMAQGMLIAVVVGYLCGRLLIYFNRRKGTMASQLLPPLVIIMLLSAIVNRLLEIAGNFQFPMYLAGFIPKHTQNVAMLYVAGMGVLTDVLSWMAIGGPFTTSPTFTDAPSWTNLQHALKIGSAWEAPYKFTDTTLFHSFANFGGNGVMLALIIAIFLFSKRQHYQSIAKWSLFPAIFNNHYPMMLGVPVLFNPLLIVPFVLSPLLNMVIAWIFITLGWIPTAVYPVPSGTPGPLIAFIGTNGNWLSLILGLILIAIDVCLYAPFVKLLDTVSEDPGEYR